VTVALAWHRAPLCHDSLANDIFAVIAAEGIDVIARRVAVMSGPLGGAWSRACSCAKRTRSTAHRDETLALVFISADHRG
jgi:hypothetical protein